MASEAEPKEFRSLRESGARPGASRRIGLGFAAARDRIARVLIRIGATPNRITVFGFLLTCGCGACLAFGAGHQLPFGAIGDGPRSLWPLWGGVLLLLSAACDMLDGAVARVGNMASRFGAVLDSTLDRFSDLAILLGCAIYFAWRGNVTYQTLCFVAVGNTFLISYIKARAEDIVPDCSVGWWQRGERYVALLLGCFFGHMPFVLWQQAILPAFTVWRRLTFAYQAVTALERGQPQPPKFRDDRWIDRVRWWRYPRGSVQFDVVAAFNILSIIVIPWICPEMLATGWWEDPVRAWLSQ